VSFAALAWAAKQRPGNLAAKMILLGLANFADEHGCAYPSTAALAEFGDMNHKTATTALDKLIELGLIHDSGEREGRTRQIKVYRLDLESLPKTEASLKRKPPVSSVKDPQKRGTDTIRNQSPKKAKPSLGKRARKPKPKVSLPDGWEPKPLTPGTVCASIVALWQPGRIERELSKFRDHHLRSDQQWSDWDAAWRTWIQRACEFERVEHGRNGSVAKRVGGHQSPDGLSPTTRAALAVFGPDPGDENRVPQ
jgi:DNA-binding transcriptional ArsR family regulator